MKACIFALWFVMSFIPSGIVSFVSAPKASWFCPYDSLSCPCSIVCNNINICQVVPVEVNLVCNTCVCLVDMLAKILRMFTISGSITFCLGLALLNS